MHHHTESWPPYTWITGDVSLTTRFSGIQTLAPRMGSQHLTHYANPLQKALYFPTPLDYYFLRAKP